MRYIFLVLFLSCAQVHATDFGKRFLPGAGMYGYGDSFGVAGGATDQAHGFSYLLAAQIGGTFINSAVSGTRTAAAARAALTNLPTARRPVAMLQSGFNDILTWGSGSYVNVAASTRAVIAAALLRENVPASAMRSSGTWVSYGSGDPGRANAIGGTAMYSTDAGAWREWDFFGDNVVVGGYTTASSQYKDFSVSIDGGSPATFAASGMTAEVYPATGFNALVLRGLGLGKHTVRVSQKSSALGTYMVVDYVGTLAAPGSTGAVLIGEIPSMVNWTYNGLTINQAIEDAANAGIAAVVAEFSGDPVFYVPVNSFYTPGTCCTVEDGEHPNNTGHAQEAAAYWASLNP